MKIITDNSARFHFPLALICRSCKSVLEASDSDLKEMQGHPIEGSYTYVQCPVCQAKNAVRPATASDHYNK